MRVSFKLRHGTDLEPDQREKLEALVGEPIQRRKDGEGWDTWHTYQADLRKLLQVLPARSIELEGPGPGDLADLEEAIQRLAAKVEAISPAFNEKVQVVVPGLGLLEVREVTVLYEQCTDMVQDYLDDGWSILAVCPQPDQRRPDYIMGRTRRES